MAKQRLDGADLIRALAVIGVIAIHAVAWPYRGDASNYYFWDDVDKLVRFAVPAFVILAGLLLAYTYPDGVKVVSFLKRRFSRSLVPWLFWAPVYLFVDWFITGELSHSTSIWVWLSYGAGHLYFLVLIPQLYLVFLIWPRSHKGVWIAAILALGFQEFLNTYRIAVFIPQNTPASELLLWRAQMLFPFWIGYFGIGIALGKLLTRVSADRAKIGWCCLVATPITALVLLAFNMANGPNGSSFAHGTGAFLLPLLPLFVFSLFGAAFFGGTALLRRSERLRKIVNVISLYSLGIYITHEALLRIPATIVQSALLQHPIPLSILGVALVVFFSLLLGLAATRLVVATPLAITVGQKRIPLRRRASSTADSA